MALPDLVCRYADRFAALGKGAHHVASPLGAWLVLALAAPSATGELAERIVDALGTDADTAHRAAARSSPTPRGPGAWSCTLRWPTTSTSRP